MLGFLGSNQSDTFEPGGAPFAVSAYPACCRKGQNSLEAWPIIYGCKISLRSDISDAGVWQSFQSLQLFDYGYTMVYTVHISYIYTYIYIYEFIYCNPYI